MIRTATYSVDMAQVHAELVCALGECYPGAPRISHIARRPSIYRTSFATDELDVYLDDGRCLEIIFKDLHRQSLAGAAQNAKPEFLYNPEREIGIYRHVLTPRQMGTARLYGAVCRPELERYWLFIERVAGRELCQVGDFDVWLEVARWLAKLHTQFGKRAQELQQTVPVILHDRAYYQRWLTRARMFAAEADTAAPLDMIARRYDQVIDRLAPLSETLLHGEFYASNVLVVTQDKTWRVCPVDWELAAVGPGLMDLAALIAGNWSEEQKQALANAYYLTLPPPRELSWDDFIEALDCCRLQTAVQWLGWSHHWSPPAQHWYDWLREATLITERLLT